MLCFILRFLKSMPFDLLMFIWFFQLLHLSVTKSETVCITDSVSAMSAISIMCLQSLLLPLPCCIRIPLLNDLIFIAKLLINDANKICEILFPSRTPNLQEIHSVMLLPILTHDSMF